MSKPLIHIFNYSVKNQSNETIDIHIDGDIVDAPTQEMLRNWFGDETSTSFKSLRNQIEKANPKTINLFINSTGGHVGDAMAIHDYLVGLENKGVTVNRNGIGIIASAATYPLMGKNSSMSENSHLIIHNSSSVAYGDINQMEMQVKNVRKFNDSIVNFYSNLTGKDKATIQDWMDNETWFTAQEAYDNHFIANKPTGQAQFTNKISPEKWNFKNQDILAVYNSFTNSNPINMDISKLTEAVTNGFKEIKNLFKNNDKPTDEVIDATINTCTTAIVNAVKEQSTGIDEAKVTEIINNILTEKLKDIAKKEDITNSIKDFVTTEKMTNALTATEKKIVKDITDNVAGGSTDIPGGEDEGDESKINNRKRKSRYTGAKNWQVTDKTPVGHD